MIKETEYQGKDVELNKPSKSPEGPPNELGWPRCMGAGAR